MRIAPVVSSALALGACLLPAVPASAQQPTPIPQGPNADQLERFIGSPAEQRPVAAAEAPRHPFMAPNGRSNIHNDAYQTDAYAGPGPLGRDMTTISTFQSAECASLTFDSRGRVVTICVGLEGPRLVMFDPRTLEQLATFHLPPRNPAVAGTGGLFSDFSGGGYFYLDQADRSVMPTTDRHIYVVAETGETPGFQLERDYDVNPVLTPGDSIVSALPDWSGRIWFVSQRGVVGAVDPATGAIRVHPLAGEEVKNSFAVDETGAVYIVSDRALYRFDAAADGTPTVTWREVYRNSGLQKPGQVDDGSGTTPTVMAGTEYVTITDNADPMNVVVYRRARSVSGRRLVCEQPVFERGASATDNSLIAAGRAIVVENNYGYSGPAATESGRTTSPGIERVDVDADGSGCRRVWRSQEHAPSVVPKLSRANGLVYTYTKDPREDEQDAWYLTALDFRTGRTVYKRLGGEGLGHNNNYAPVSLGPDGSAYVGVLGGLLLLRDATPPPRPPSPPRPTPRAPRLGLALGYRTARGRRGRCVPAAVLATVLGADRRLIRRAGFALDRGPFRTDARAPFRRLVHRRHGGWHGIHLLRVRVLLRDGRRVTLSRRFRACVRRSRRER